MGDDISISVYGESPFPSSDVVYVAVCVMDDFCGLSEFDDNDAKLDEQATKLEICGII